MRPAHAFEVRHRHHFHPYNREKTGRITAILPDLAAEKSLLSDRFRISPHARREQNNNQITGAQQAHNRSIIRAYQVDNRWVERAKTGAKKNAHEALALCGHRMASRATRRRHFHL